MSCLVCAFLLNDYVEDKLILITTSSVLSLSMAINSPSAKAVVPNVISSENIESFNSLQNTLSSAIKVVSPLVGALLLSVFNNFNVFILINSLSFLISAILISTVPYNNIKQDSNKQNFVKRLVSGLKYVINKRKILGILIFISFLNFIMISYDLALPYIINVILNKSEDFYSLTISLEAIGGIIGGIVLTYVSKRRKDSNFVSDIKYLCMILLIAGIFKNIYFIFGCALINGYFLVQINAKVFTIIQKETSQEYLGRVFSILFIFSSLLVSPSNIIFGKLVPVLSWNIFIFCSFSIFVMSYIVNKNFIKDN
ncbi:MFS transporter [Facklamia miroungae]|nr:MFS transporter [Facklamia miroungae]